MFDSTTFDAATFDIFVGVSAITGTLAATEAPDVAAFTGSSAISGSLAVTEAPDVAAFTGFSAISGSLAVTEATDTAVFVGPFILPLFGAWASTENVDRAAFNINVPPPAPGLTSPPYPQDYGWWERAEPIIPGKPGPW